jgi:hypothetical protein
MNNLAGEKRDAIINTEQVLSIRREGKCITIRYINDSIIDAFTFITEYDAQCATDLIFDVGNRNMIGV